MIERVYDFLKSAGVFFLATQDNTSPKIRPFGFVMIYNDRLYFCTNNQKAVYHQMRENPQIEICACKNTEWIRVSGKAVFDADMEAKKQVFIADPGMSGLYKAEDEIFEVFYLTEGQASFCSMDGKCENIKF